MTNKEKKVIQRTYHEIAVLADEKAKELRNEDMFGKPNKSYGAGYDIGYAEALEDFAQELWLRINDFDIEEQVNDPR